MWCAAADVSFGHVSIPATLDETSLASTADGPEPECSSSDIVLGNLTTRSHGVRGTVVILSERMIEIRGFEYDGLGPAAYWWADTNAAPSDDGFVLLDGPPTNGCGTGTVEGADGSSNVRVEFPEGTSVLDIRGGSISVWCERFSTSFGDIFIPEDLDMVPSTGPPLECSEKTAIPDIAKTPAGYNCEPLNEQYQVRWAVDGKNIAVEMVGLIDATDYMSFGVSGLQDRTWMLGADVVVGDMFGGSYRARDFYMNDRSQCSGSNGVCPDTELAGAVDDVSNISGETDMGVTLIRYTKPLASSDIDGTAAVGQEIDQPLSVVPGEFTYIAWALGPVSPDTGLP